MEAREFLLDLFSESLKAVLPGQLIRDNLTVSDDRLVVHGHVYAMPAQRRLHVFGSGKASVPAARELENMLGDRLAGGMVVTNHDDGTLKRLQVCIGSHPVPDQRSVAAAELLGQAMASLGKDDFFLYLLSGGSSALLEQPMAPLTIEDLQATTKLLIAGGLAIHEINAVRKHLSLVKGGRLAGHIRAQGAVLVISDVIGDDLETIGSAPLFFDRSDYRQVSSILSRHGLWDRLPSRVAALLAEGLAGKLPDTPKKPPPRLAHFLIGNNTRALQRAKSRAEAVGVPAPIMTARLRGEACEVAKAIIAMGEEILASGQPFAPPVCLLFGGETTVHVRGSGRGGRNQELCLAALQEIGDRQGLVFFSAGTDGIDGNTEAAGALVDCRSSARLRDLGLDIGEALAHNDANTLLARTGDLVVTGPTGTNVMDMTMLFVG